MHEFEFWVDAYHVAWIIYDEDMIQSIVEQYAIENLINWVTINKIWTL